MEVGPSKRVTVNGVTGVSVSSTPGTSQGYLLPDDRGGYIYYAPGSPVAPPKPARVDAEEVRLYARELASQITGGLSGESPLFGVVSVPTAFIDQDTRSQSSFGRLMGEQMIDPAPENIKSSIDKVYNLFLQNNDNPVAQDDIRTLFGEVEP